MSSNREKIIEAFRRFFKLVQDQIPKWNAALERAIPALKSAANLAQTHSVCSEADISDTPLGISCPDIQERLLRKLTMKISNEYMSIEDELKILETVHTKISKERANALSVYCELIGSLSPEELDEEPQYIPRISQLVEWIFKVDNSFQDEYMLRKCSFGRTDFMSESDVKSFTKRWTNTQEHNDKLTVIMTFSRNLIEPPLKGSEWVEKCRNTFAC